MLQAMDELSRKAGKRRFQFFTKFEAWNSLRKFFHEDKRARRADLHTSSCRPCRA